MALAARQGVTGDAMAITASNAHPRACAMGSSPAARHAAKPLQFGISRRYFMLQISISIKSVWRLIRPSTDAMCNVRCLWGPKP